MSEKFSRICRFMLVTHSKVPALQEAGWYRDTVVPIFWGWLFFTLIYGNGRRFIHEGTVKRHS